MKTKKKKTKQNNEGKGKKNEKKKKIVPGVRIELTTFRYLLHDYERV